MTEFIKRLLGRDGQWHDCSPLFRRSLVAVDGSSLAGELNFKRRWRNGKWEYRRLTVEEEEEHFVGLAW